MTESPSCLRLLTHCERRAASRAACTAGNSRAISTAMIAMTTSSSIRVKPLLREVMRRTLDGDVRQSARFRSGLAIRLAAFRGRPGVEVPEDVVAFQGE